MRPIHDNRMGHETIYLHAGQAEEKGDDDENMQASLGSKLTEVLYRNKIKDVEAKAKVQEEQATLALHEKQRNAMLLKKVQKAHPGMVLEIIKLQKI